jgi:hypothetical protein
MQLTQKRQIVAKFWKTKLFNKQKAEWYQKLKDENFPDIEDHSGSVSVLKSWDSFRFVSKEAQERKAAQEEYQNAAELLLQNPNFIGICETIVKHKGSKLTVNVVVRIWELHCEGKIESEIVSELNTNRRAIQRVLRKLQQWMKLI